ncbi:Schlafen family member 5, partial [Paramuricea clavata]
MVKHIRDCRERGRQRTIFPKDDGETKEDGTIQAGKPTTMFKNHKHTTDVPFSIQADIECMIVNIPDEHWENRDVGLGMKKRFRKVHVPYMAGFSVTLNMEIEGFEPIMETIRKRDDDHEGVLRRRESLSKEILRYHVSGNEENLPEDGFNYLEKFVGKDPILKQKDVFPYEYIDCMKKLDETCLPSKEDFFSSLTNKGISNKDYTRAQETDDVDVDILKRGDHLEYFDHSNYKEDHPMYFCDNKMELGFMKNETGGRDKRCVCHPSKDVRIQDEQR